MHRQTISCTNDLNSVKGLSIRSAFPLKLASADLVMNGDFSRVFMHIVCEFAFLLAYIGGKSSALNGIVTHPILCVSSVCQCE